MSRVSLRHFSWLAAASALIALYGCPMATPGGGESPAAVTPGGGDSTAPSAEGSPKETPTDTTNSQPVAMPNGIFSSGTTPECTLVLVMQATPLCFYGDSGKRVKLAGQIKLECLEKDRVQPFESPAIRFVNNNAEYVELPVSREDRSFSAEIRTHQSETALDSCFVNYDPVLTFAAPNILDSLPCAGDECRVKCDGVFDRIEMISINERNLPHIDRNTGDLEFARVNLLPPCGTEPDRKPGAVPFIDSEPIRQADPVVCKPTTGGLFRCNQGQDAFCATLFGERRDCPAQ